MIEMWVREATLAISLLVEAIAAVLVAFAVIEAVVRLALALRRTDGSGSASAHAVKEAVRLHLGKWLALALELLLGADILRTAVAPSWSEIGKLAAIAAIRTALNFFLQREIDAARFRDEAGAAGAEGPDGGVQSSADQRSSDAAGTGAVRARS